MKNDIVRERYYKAKGHPGMGRGVDGETDIYALFFGPTDVASIRWRIDLERRDPEDPMSMDCCSYTREFHEMDKCFDEQWTPDPRRENRALLVYPLMDSEQSRENG